MPSAKSAKAKRLKQTGDTLRELFLKSGNLCAFPHCSRLMMDAEGHFVGQVCHIEAAVEGGERFNEKMTDEDRRHFSNLMLMCYEHHTITDDEDIYDVAKLRQIKADHEKKFSQVDRTIRESLKDWTEDQQPSQVSNLRKMSKILGWNYDDDDLKEPCKELNELIIEFRNIPHDTRNFVGVTARRMLKLENTWAVKKLARGTIILASDLQSALQMPTETMRDFLANLEAYHLGYVDDMDSGVGPQPGVFLYDMESGWPFWIDLAKFCDIEKIDMMAFTHDLEFSRLDE